MSPAELSQSLSLFLPELALAIGAMVLLMIGVYSPKETANRFVTGLSVALLIGALLWMAVIGGQGTGFSGALVQDGFAVFMKVLTLVGSAVALIIRSPWKAL